MHRRAHVLLLLLAALLAGATAFAGLMISTGPVQPAEQGSGENGPGEEPAAPAVLRGGPEGALPTVVVSVSVRGEYHAPAVAPPRPVLARADGTHAEVEVEWVAGTAALPWLPAARRGPQLARIRFGAAGDADDEYRVVRLDGDERVVAFPFDGPHGFEGVVADVEGAPVAGVEIWLAGQRTRSDSAGRFAVSGLRGGSGLPLVLRAEGYAAHYREVDARQPVRGAFVLRPAARLDVGLAAEGAETVSVLPASGAAAGSTALRHYPFFMAALEPRAPVNERWSFDDLPQAVEVRAATGTGLTASVPLRAAPRAVTVPTPALRRVSGRVVDGAGAPIAAAWVLAGRTGDAGRHRDDAFLLSPAALLAGTAHTRTGEDGRFSLWASADWRGPLTVIAPGCLRLEATADRDEVGELICLAADVEQAAALRFTAGAGLRLVLERGSSRDAGRALAAGESWSWTLPRPALLDVRVGVGAVLGEVQRLAVAGATPLPLAVPAGAPGQ